MEALENGPIKTPRAKKANVKKTLHKGPKESRSRHKKYDGKDLPVFWDVWNRS